VSELSGATTELLFQPPYPEIDLKIRQQFMSTLNEIMSSRNESIRIDEHHQYGVSRPVINQLLDRMGTEMIIVPQSFQQSRNYIHKSLLSALNKLHYPLMLLPLGEAVPAMIQRALYLNQDPGPAVMPLSQFAFHIIHQNMLTESMQREPLKQVVSDFKIDLVVQSREGSRVPQNNELTTELCLPVLTV